MKTRNKACKCINVYIYMDKVASGWRINVDVD